MFRKLICLGTQLLVVYGSASAQTTSKDHQRTAAPADSRYEILESAFAAKYTFRLDKYTGETGQLVMQEDSTVTWKSLPKLEHPLPDTKIAGRPNYQIFMSGIAARYTFLLNLNTGATWQLAEDSQEGLFWTPLYTTRSKAP